DVIANGRNVTKEQKTMMPAFARKRGGMLSPAQIDVLVYEIKGSRYKVVKKGHGVEPNYEVVKDPDGKDPEGKQPAWGIPGPLPKDAPPYTYEPPMKGTPNFARLNKLFADRCGSCHGDDGGGGDSGAINDPAFLALTSDQALRRILITGRLDLKVEGKDFM